MRRTTRMPYAWRLSPPYPPLLDRAPTLPEPVETAAPAVNLTSVVALSSGLLGMLILPVVLGPVAVLCGVLGVTLGRRSSGAGGWAGTAGIALGLLATALFVLGVG